MFSLDVLPPSPSEILFYRLSEAEFTTVLCVTGVVIVLILGILLFKKKR